MLAHVVNFILITDFTEFDSMGPLFKEPHAEGHLVLSVPAPLQ